MYCSIAYQHTQDTDRCALCHLSVSYLCWQPFKHISSCLGCFRYYNAPWPSAGDAQYCIVRSSLSHSSVPVTKISLHLVLKTRWGKDNVSFCFTPPQTLIYITWEIIKWSKLDSSALLHCANCMCTVSNTTYIKAAAACIKSKKKKKKL